MSFTQKMMQWKLFRRRTSLTSTATNPDLFEEEDAPDFSRQEFDWDTGRFLPEGGASNG